LRLVFDIAYNSGGSEAIAESVYSIMKLHLTSATRQLESLAIRTKVDWHLPKSQFAIPQYLRKCVVKHRRKKVADPFLKVSDPRTEMRVQSKAVANLARQNSTIFN